MTYIFLQNLTMSIAVRNADRLEMGAVLAG
jgi:hypothetical protein